MTRRWTSAKGGDREPERGWACEVKVVMTGSADGGREWQPLIPAGQEPILERDSGKPRWLQGGTELSRAFALRAAETRRLTATWAANARFDGVTSEITGHPAGRESGPTGR